MKLNQEPPKILISETAISEEMAEKLACDRANLICEITWQYYLENIKQEARAGELQPKAQESARAMH